MAGVDALTPDHLRPQDPTDLPMDGSGADPRLLLEKAVRALEDAGRDVTGTADWREECSARAMLAHSQATWLRACMAPDEPEMDAVRDDLAAGTERATTEAQALADAAAGWQGGGGGGGAVVHVTVRPDAWYVETASHREGTFDAEQLAAARERGAGRVRRAEARARQGSYWADNGGHGCRGDDVDLAAGVAWTQHDPLPSFAACPCDPDRMVFVASHRPADPLHVAWGPLPAGSRYWGSGMDTECPIRWWRYATDAEAASRFTDLRADNGELPPGDLEPNQQLGVKRPIPFTFGIDRGVETPSRPMRANSVVVERVVQTMPDRVQLHIGGQQGVYRLETDSLTDDTVNGAMP